MSYQYTTRCSDFCPVIYSLRGELEPYEQKWVEPVKSLLIKKKKLSDFVVDINLLCIFTSLTEMQCRRLLNYIEWNEFQFTTFKIINGSEEWKRQDEIRAAKVQSANEGANT